MTYTKCGDMSLMRMFIFIMSLGIALGASINPHYGENYHKVCENVVIHQIDDLRLLLNCTVVEGFLHIYNIVENTIPATTSFPLLREITGHVLLYRVQNRPPLSVMFPNLAVIRGDALLEHYALIIEELTGPSDLILPALKVIKRGAIFVNMVENVTKKDELFWQTNFPLTQIKVKDELNFCSSGCYKKENNSKLYKATYDTNNCPSSCPGNCNKIGKCCSSQCLGGCYRESDPSSCIACRNFREGDHCKGTCSGGRYKFRHRCVEIEHCIENSLAVQEDSGQCYEKGEGCPPNTKKEGFFCVPCPKDSCLKICDPGVITTMAEVRSLAGCQVIKGSLIINIAKDGVHSEEEVAESLVNLKEIRGYLKISRNEFETLGFLKSIRTIGGNSLYKNSYSLVIQRNSKLKSVLENGSAGQLSITLNRGSVLIDSNEAFCMSEVNKLESSLRMKEDGMHLLEAHSNGLDISCASNELKIWILEAKSPWNITVFWISRTNPYMYILYYIKTNLTLTTEHFFSNCNENLAQKKYLSSKLKNNSVEVTGLEPHSKYAFLLRRLPQGTDSDGYREAISEIAYGSTASYKPSMPRQLTVKSNDSSSLNTSWLGPLHPNGVVTHYRVSIQLVEDRKSANCRFCSLKDKLKSCLCASSSGDTGQIPLSQVPTELGDTQSLEQAYQHMADDSEMFDVYNFENFNLGDSLPLKVPVSNERVVTRAEKTEYEHSTVDKSKGWLKMSSILTKSTTHVFQNLRYFGLYALSISACQCSPAGVIDSSVRCNLCSPSKLTVLRVRKNEDADLIKDVIFNELEQQEGNLELKWHRPSDPNSPIVAYTIEVRGESHTNNIVAVCVRASNSSNGTAILKDIGSGNFRVRITAWNAAANGPSNHWIPYEIQNSSSKTVIIVIVVVSVIVECIFGLVIYLFWKRFRNWYLLPKYEAYICKRDFVHISSVLSQFKNEHILPREDLEIQQVICNGNFRSVSEATIRNEERTKVALKVPKNDFSQRALELFLKEALLLQNLDFTHVVKLLKVVVENGEYMYAMEYMEKRDLKSYLRSTCSRVDLPDQVMMRLAFDAAAGMAYLSSVGIIHRNLSSFNCLLDSHSCLKISGFGMAVNVNNSDNSSYFLHDLPIRWRAPESLANFCFSLKSDVWSYGVLLWEIASGGQTPYEGISDEHINETVSRAGTFLTVPPFTLPIFVTLRNQCLQCNPQLRPTFFSILSDLMKDMPYSLRVEHCVKELLRKIEDSRALSEVTDEMTSSETINNSITDSSYYANTADVNPFTDVSGINKIENLAGMTSSFVKSNFHPCNCPNEKETIIELESAPANAIRKQPSVEEELLVKMCSCKSPIPNTCRESPLRRAFNKCPFGLASISESIMDKKYEEEQFNSLLQSDFKASVDVTVGDTYSSRPY